MTGFGHGNAGIAYTLSKVFKVNEDNKLITLMQKALAKENIFYSEQYRNWEDMRSSAKVDHSILNPNMKAWCVGASGVGLGRIGMLKSFNYNNVLKKYLLNDIYKVFDSLRLDNSAYGHSLCHGDFGNLDFFYELYKLKIMSKFDFESLFDFTKRNFENSPKLSVYNSFFNNGLFVGYSGPYYQYLRFKYDLPSLLLLEEPI